MRRIKQKFVLQFIEYIINLIFSSQFSVASLTLQAWSTLIDSSAVHLNFIEVKILVPGFLFHQISCIHVMHCTHAFTWWI